MKTCSRVLSTSDWGDGSPSNRTTTLSTQPRQRRSGFGTSLNVLEWPSQILDLNPIEHLWRNLTISVQLRSPSNLTELERICREEWEKLPKYRCAKLVASYPRRFEVVSPDYLLKSNPLPSLWVVSQCKEGILEVAQDGIPSVWSSTPLVLKATAGLRLLPGEKATLTGQGERGVWSLHSCPERTVCL
uniref:Uncharacterized protein n=1 Tax=Oncorhynchus kisutch TaxID=8019 RepID=A0A8C7CR95_ONCKI